jgi:hypothetical protein
MGDELALRLLDVVRHRLGALDARIEIGGEAPSSASAVWVALNPHRRIVAVFEGPPPEEAGTKLAAIVDAFAASADAPASDGPAALSRRTLPAEIDAELNGLAVRANAVCAVLIDVSSPVVWGRSHGELAGEIGPMLDIANAVDEADPAAILADASQWPDALREHAGDDRDLARRVLTAALAVRSARDSVVKVPTAVGSVHRIDRRGNYAFMTRSLAGVYLLILAFEGGFSEPQAEGVIRRSSTLLENLIVKLPPTDPPPRPGRVLSLRRPSE